MMRSIFLAPIFLIAVLLIPSLGYEVVLNTPDFVQPNETFQVSFDLLNASDIAGFQIDVFTNAQILKVEKGASIQHWSIFTYKIEDSSVRIVAARYKENTIDSGTLVVLTLRSTSDVVNLRYEGLLVDSAGKKVAKFSGETSLSKPVTTTPTPTMQKAETNFIEFAWIIPWILQNKIAVLLAIGVVLGLVIWKLKFS